MIVGTKIVEATKTLTLPEVGNGWELTETVIDGCHQIHTVPEDDYRPHAHRHDCWCHPVEDDIRPDLYVHKALDNREWFFDNPAH